MHSTAYSRRKFLSDWLTVSLELHSCIQLHDDHVVGDADHCSLFEANIHSPIRR